MTPDEAEQLAYGDVVRFNNDLLVVEGITKEGYVRFIRKPSAHVRSPWMRRASLESFSRIRRVKFT